MISGVVFATYILRVILLFFWPDRRRVCGPFRIVLVNGTITILELPTEALIFTVTNAIHLLIHRKTPPRFTAN